MFGHNEAQRTNKDYVLYSYYMCTKVINLSLSLNNHEHYKINIVLLDVKVNVR